MPTLAHVKVYNPGGTRYAQARGSTAAEAMVGARAAFVREFGELPHQWKMVFEIVGVTGDWVCDLFEVKG